MQLGFVGTGVMGAAMVRCLLEAGHHVTVHDRRREATAPVCALGAQWTETPKAVAAESEVVFTSLPGPPEVELVHSNRTHRESGDVHGVAPSPVRSAYRTLSRMVGSPNSIHVRRISPSLTAALARIAASPRVRGAPCGWRSAKSPRYSS